MLLEKGDTRMGPFGICAAGEVGRTQRLVQRQGSLAEKVESEPIEVKEGDSETDIWGEPFLQRDR